MDCRDPKWNMNSLQPLRLVNRALLIMMGKIQIRKVYKGIAQWVIPQSSCPLWAITFFVKRILLRSDVELLGPPVIRYNLWENSAESVPLQRSHRRNQALHRGGFTHLWALYILVLLQNTDGRFFLRGTRVLIHLAHLYLV